MIRGTLTGDDAVLERLAAIPVRAEAGLSETAARLAGEIQAEADRNLSGSLLKLRTGTLRASLESQVDQTGDGLSVAVRATAPYAAFQEYGFTGVENVRAYLRQQTVAFGRPIAPVTVAVRAHARHVDYAGRSYLRAALAAIAPTVKSALSDGFAEAVQ